MPHSDPISVQDLLRRAKTKTRQTTYRNRHSRVPAAAPHTSGQHIEHAKPIEHHNRKFTSLASQIVRSNEKAVRKRRTPRRAPEKGLAVVKSIEEPQPFRSLPRGWPSSDRDTHRIKKRALEPKDAPKANEARKLRPLSKSIQTEIIDLKDFKFPPRPQTPDVIGYADWTPGSGFDGTHTSIPSTISKRLRRVRRRVSSIGGELQLEASNNSKASENENFSELPPSRRLEFGNSHQVLTKARGTLDRSRGPSEPATAEKAKKSEDRQPLQETRYEDCRLNERSIVPDGIQNIREATQIGQALAENLNKMESSLEGTPSTSSPPEVSERAHPLAHSEVHTRADEAGGVNTHLRLPSALSFFPYQAYPHPPSSALPSIPGRNADAPDESVPSSAQVPRFPLLYQAYPRPLSWAPSEPTHHDGVAAPMGSGEKCGETDSESGPGQSKSGEDSSDKEFPSAPPDAEEESEGTDTDSRSGQPKSESNASGERNIDPPAKYSSLSPSSSDPMLEETWDGIASSPNQPSANPLPISRLTTGGYFANAVQQLSSPVKPSQTLALPRRKSHAVPALPYAHAKEEKEEEKQACYSWVSHRA